MLLKTLTDGQATDDFERELSCCGFNNALDYCDRKLKSLKSNGSHLMNMDITGALFTLRIHYEELSIACGTLFVPGT